MEIQTFNKRKQENPFIQDSPILGYVIKEILFCRRVPLFVCLFVFCIYQSPINDRTEQDTFGRIDNGLLGSGRRNSDYQTDCNRASYTSNRIDRKRYRKKLSSFFRSR